MLTGKTVILGVTGSIAAYKTANLASMLVKQHCDVHVIMTKNATNFIHPTAFETLTNNKCLIDTFDRNFNFDVKHVSLAKKADLFLTAPASANIIAKFAYGIADDMLSTTALACKCKKLVAPAMNTNMFENPIVQDNLNRLRQFGFEIIEPDSGFLACRDTGKGKLPKEEVLMDYIMRELHYEKDMEGIRVLVTAGPTREAIDPVRYLTNHSTGKMGYAIAKTAMERGADVTLVSGPVSLEAPKFVNTIPVVSAADMFQAVMDRAEQADIIIKAAAVADYTPVAAAEEKIKKQDGSSSISLKRTEDILATLGKQKRPHQFLCGFSMETEHLLENSTKKLEKKNADMIVANSLRTAGAGFGTDTNVVTLITKDGAKELPLMGKDEVAYWILSEILERRK
jgi:phosphopantothenoylcysteine decarboxylase/phosphopantothenate--cysteine ligase